MKGSESQTLVKGALFLTLAGLISKVLSAGYRIPLQNLTGDLGFYIYQQVYPLLGIGLILALYGFPSAVSKLTAEAKTGGKSISLKQFYMPIFLILFMAMSVIVIFLYMTADQLSIWIGDEGLSFAYKLAALSFLVIPFTAMARGIYQGHGQMRPTAYSQVTEQIVRVSIIIFVAVYISQMEVGLYRVGEAASVASLFGGLTALFTLFYFKEKKQWKMDHQAKIPWMYYIRTILFFGFVASLNHMVLLLMQFADAFTLMPSLMDYGMSQLDAMKAKGVFDRGQPLIQLGTVLGSSFALAMVPKLTQEKRKENQEQFYKSIQNSMMLSLILAVGATVGLIAIMKEANILLYQDDIGTSDLQILVLAILLSATGITASTILQGLGFVRQTALFILIALVLKWFGNLLLVPLFGITGSAIATVASLLVFFLLLLFELQRKLPELKLIRQMNWGALILAVGGMLAYIFIINLFIPTDLSRLSALFYVGWIAITGSLLYFFILFRTRAFTKEQIQMLPYAKIWLRIARYKHT